MIDALDAFKAEKDLAKIIFSQINASLIHDYGIVETVVDASTVIVRSLQKRQGVVRRYDCRYLTLNSSAIGTSTPPSENDLVVVMFLQHKQKKTFEATDSFEVSRPTGYGAFSGVAIPFGIFTGSSDVKITVDKDNSKVKVETSFDLDVDANEIHLNGADKSLTKYPDLDTALQGLINNLNAQLNAIKTAAATAVASGGYWTTPLPSLGGLSLDISAAEATTVKTGA